MKAENIKPKKEEEIIKENQDFPNLPAASEEVKSERVFKKQIKKTSKLNPDGKTDNTEEKSEN